MFRQGRHETALASFSDGPAGALALVTGISDLSLRRLLAETHQALPFGSLRSELQGIEARLPQSEVEGLAAKEAGDP